MPNPDGTLTDAERAAIDMRRQQYAYNGSGTGGGVPGSGKYADGTPYAMVSEDQNTADVNAENADDAKRKALALANANAASPTGVATYRDQYGDNQMQGTNLSGLTSSLLDPTSKSSLAYQYGGQIGGAQAAIERDQGLAANADNRAAIQANYDQANQSRGAEYNALGLYQSAAMGNGPSAAQAQFQQGLDRSLQGNMALANSARGGSLALAQGRLAAEGQNTGMLAGANAQAAQLRAQEQQAGMAGYAGLAGNIRGQDVGQATNNANLALQSRSANDARSMGYEQLGANVAAQQLGAQQNRVNGLLSSEGALTSAQAQNAALQAQANQQSYQNTLGAIGTGAAVVGGIAGAAGLVGLGGKPTPSNAPATTSSDGGASGSLDTSAGGMLGNAGYGSSEGGMTASTESYTPTLTSSSAPTQGIPVSRPAAAASSPDQREIKRYW